jgi:hypothetical protein
MNMIDAPKNLLSNGTRIGALVAVAGALALGWAVAARESHKGVELSTVALSGQVTLPQVVVVVRRASAGDTQVALASPAPSR